jgi:hypothetical protein
LLLKNVQSKHKLVKIISMIDQTKKKQAIVVAIILLTIAVISFFAYLFISPAATCSDKKQNQSEKGIDCGGPCSPCAFLGENLNLISQDATFVDGGNGTYDVVAKISDPSDTVGAKSFSYTFTLKDANGSVIATKQGSDFILPLDNKYIAELGLQTKDNAAPSKVEIALSNIEWTKLGDLQKPRLGVYSKKFDKDTIGDGSLAQGIVRNESGFDLNKVSLVVILRAAGGKIVGVNVTQKNVLRAGEQQDFKLNWPYALAGDVQSMEVDAQSNILDPANFSTTSR